MHLQDNTLLQKGKYRIIRFINSGGFGCTYEVEHVMLRKRMAIKEFFVRDFCNRDEETAHVTVATESKKKLVEKLLQKFIEEAQALSQLQHPGIVRVSDVFEENDTAYFVMDYIDGKSLRQIVKENGPLPESLALKYIFEVAKALQFVHAHNRLHLDIKPGNIMVDRNNRAVLIDFGASKQYDEENGENNSTLLGKTPGYAPIEQLGNNVSQFLPATDIYALGATFYSLLTGKTPISAEALVNDEQMPPLPSSVSETVRHAIEAAMEVSKKRRPQSVKEFMDLLKVEDAQSDLEEQDEETIFVQKVEESGLDDEAKNNENVKSVTQKENLPSHKESKGKSRMLKVLLGTSSLVLIGIFAFIYFSKTGDGQNKKIESDRFMEDSEVSRTVSSLEEDAVTVNPEESEVEMTSDKAEENVPLSEETPEADVEEVSESAGLRNEKPEVQQRDRSHEDISIVPTGSVEGHDYVDLGLSVKWATCNLGASCPEKKGDYFYWGKTVSVSQNRETGIPETVTHIGGRSDYDAACAQWNGTWRMPSKQEWQELIDNCSCTWVRRNGIAGYMVKSKKNGRRVFFPAAGYWMDNQSCEVGGYGGYLSADRYEHDAYSFYGIFFRKGDFSVGWSDSSCGHNVRPVTE